MPNIDSAKKRVRQNAKRTAVNHARKSRIRSYTRKAEEALALPDSVFFSPAWNRQRFSNDS
jgi:small subunit ribosomal protein S20